MWIVDQGTRILGGLVHLLYPPLCASCGEVFQEAPDMAICPRCRRMMEVITGDLCERCGHPLSEKFPERRGLCPCCPLKPVWFDRARAALVYEAAIREVIHNLKFRFHTRLVPFLRPYLRQVYASHYDGAVETLVPVPLHWWRRRWREFNQAALLARALSQSVDMPVQEDILVRSRYTTPQSKIRGGRKRRNVSGAFRVKKGRSVAGKRILLIDDVYTSGSTVNECARVLKEAGASYVAVLTVARVVRG